MWPTAMTARQPGRSGGPLRGGGGGSASSPCPLRVGPTTVVTHRSQWSVMGVPRGLEASPGDAVLAQGTGHLQGQGAAHPALASRGLVLWAVEAPGQAQVYRQEAWVQAVEKEMVVR